MNLKKDIRETWLWESSDRVKYYIDLVYMCDNGDVNFSLGSLSKRWLISRSAVRNFLMQCEKYDLLKKTPYGAHLNSSIVGGCEEEEHNLRTVSAQQKPKKTLADKQREMIERKQAFYNSLVPYVERFGKEIVRAFYDYWSEANKSQTKMRFESEKTFELNLRLSTWERNNTRYEQSSKSTNERAFQSAVEQQNRIRAIGEKLSDGYNGGQEENGEIIPL